MHKLRENAEKELKAIEEKGLTSSNLDNAYKLVEIMKGVDKIEMMQDGGEYSKFVKQEKSHETSEIKARGTSVENWGVIVTVDREALRQQLEKDGILAPGTSH